SLDLGTAGQTQEYRVGSGGEGRDIVYLCGPPRLKVLDGLAVPVGENRQRIARFHHILCHAVPHQPDADEAHAGTGGHDCLLFSSSAIWARMIEWKSGSALKPASRARSAEKFRGHPATIVSMTGSRSRRMRRATSSPATSRRASIISPTVTDRPGMVSERRG